MQTPVPLWQADAQTKAGANLSAYMAWLAHHRQLHFDDYHGLWQWSVTDTRAFWQSIWDYFEVVSHSDYSAVHSDDDMPDTRWFEGATLNYAEHIFRRKTSAYPALIFQAEQAPVTEMSWAALEQQVAAVAQWLRSQGVQAGDRVAAYLPNIPEATVAFLATCSLGAVWSSCSPDFGVESVVERFQQIAPKVLIVVDGYRYGGKPFDKQGAVRAMLADMPSVERVLIVPFLDAGAGAFVEGAALWGPVASADAGSLTFTPVPFAHPIWILYSSGTTGMPKAITHSQGGVLLEHLKYLAFHNDVKPGERFFWFSTTGWMMWNVVQASLLCGATVVLYEGSPGYPNLNVLWQMAQDLRLTHFGTSAPYLVACLKAGLQPGASYDLSALRSVSSTGAPLPPEGFEWVYEQVKKDVWLCSMSGGTDVCTAFVGGVPLLPVYRGEIQARALGCAMYAYDEAGHPVVGEVGEMVIVKPMPSMPIYFWNDPGKERYLSSYFEMYPGGVWRHGDWLLVTERHSLVIKGRSDATLNRQGVRIGTAEIYRAVDKLPDVRDSLIVNLEMEGGEHFMPLFVWLNEGYTLSKDLEKRIAQILRSTYSPRHVPDKIVAVPDIPYTISGKKLEAPVKKILMGIPVEKAANKGAMRNPESLDFFVQYATQLGQ